MQPFVEMRHLRYFVAVAEELNMGRAADRLHIVKPALSRQIGALERELGLKLFNREKGRLSLTPAGAAFAEQAEDVLRRVENATNSAQAIARGEMGTLQLGAIGTAMWGTVLPAILREHRRRFPSLGFRIHERMPRQQLAQLRDGSLDVAFLRSPGPDDEIHFETIAHETLMVALPDNHPLAAEEAIDLSDLVTETLVMPPALEAPTFYARCIELCAANGFSPGNIEEADTFGGGMHLVASGVGVKLTPSGVASWQWPGIVIRPLKGQTAELDLSVAYLRGREGNGVAAFMESVSHSLNS